MAEPPWSNLLPGSTSTSPINPERKRAAVKHHCSPSATSAGTVVPARCAEASGMAVADCVRSPRPRPPFFPSQRFLWRSREHIGRCPM